MTERCRPLSAALRREPVLALLVLLQVLLLAAQAVLWHTHTEPLTLVPEAGLTAYGDGQVTAAGVENTGPGTFAATSWCALRAGMYRMTAHYAADADAAGTMQAYSTLALADSGVPLSGGGVQRLR